MMEKTKVMIVSLCIVCGICNAATYFVGDSSGWDISSDLESWTLGKTFSVGDLLIFQYSSPHTVEEVTRDGFESCNTTKALQTFSGGNTTVALSEPGDRFFVCGNKLHCFAGMRLQVHVPGANAPSPSPAGAPRAAVLPSSKTNSPVTSGYSGGRRGILGISLSLLLLSLCILV